MHRIPGRLLAALVASLALSATASAQSEGGVKALTIQPSRFAEIARVGAKVGPVSLTNTTRTAYNVKVYPVLLDQTFDGAVGIDDSGAARALARQFVAVQNTSFALDPGKAASTLAAVTKITSDHYLYGGVLFEATPNEGKGAPQIQQILRLNSSLFLDPPVRLRRIDFKVRPTFAQQAGTRRLRLITSITNRGNYYTPASGTLFLRDLDGNLKAKLDLNHLKILPTKTVGLQALLAKPVLPAGVYLVNALIRSGSHRFKSFGRIRLYGPNTVRGENAQIDDFASPQAEPGEPVDVKATYKNTGNARFAPDAKLVVSPLNRQGQPSSSKTVPMTAEEADPGKIGKLSTKIDLPRGATAGNLKLQLIVGGRVVDERSVGVSFVPKGSGGGSWISDNLWLVILLALLLLAGIAYLVRRWRRDAGAPAETAVAAPAPSPVVAAPTAPASPGVVNINTASIDELTQLPGVGVKAAQRIIDHRDEYGTFDSIEGLLEVEGFGEKRIEALRARVSV